MKNKIAKLKKDLFYRCQGSCKICMNEGDCDLEKDIRKYGLSHISRLIYNS